MRWTARDLIGTANVVQITRRAIQHAVRGHRRATSEHETVGLGQTGHRRSDALLQLGERHLPASAVADSSATVTHDHVAVAGEPFDPPSTHGRRQHQVIPQVDQLIDVDEVADVVGSALTQHLLVHPDALTTIGQVIRRIRPTAGVAHR